jgi:hypothetical protein
MDNDSTRKGKEGEFPTASSANSYVGVTLRTPSFIRARDLLTLYQIVVVPQLVPFYDASLELKFKYHISIHEKQSSKT